MHLAAENGLADIAIILLNDQRFCIDINEIDNNLVKLFIWNLHS